MKERDYDLIIADIKTPVMNGKEFYWYLLDTKPEMARRIIFTTGDVMDGDTIEFIKKVDRPCLPKPFTPSELREMVHNVLQKIEYQPK
jgi:CheY-like chemotaxis protein